MEIDDLTKSKYRFLARKYNAKPINQCIGERLCRCGESYSVKYADLKRGWGMSCSKSCASIKKVGGKSDFYTKI